MSQVSSSSGVRVAAQPLSNVYTVLLLLGAVALVLTFLMLAVTMDSRYGAVLGVSEEGKAAKKAPDAAKARQQNILSELEQTDKALKDFPEGVMAPAVGDIAPPAPAAGDTPPPAAETTPPAAGDAAPAPAAGTTPPAAGDAAPAAGTTPPAAAPAAEPAAK
ncbi:MAG TPA: hypothetical protein VM431_13395 [Phycisphaerae bacterium]|nr:hypothetical protein [Phycisphaerae bacterium]